MQIEMQLRNASLKCKLNYKFECSLKITSWNATLKCEIEMQICCVLKILLDGCHKKLAWSDPTRVKTQDTSIAVGTIGYGGGLYAFCLRILIEGFSEDEIKMTSRELSQTCFLIISFQIYPSARSFWVIPPAYREEAYSKAKKM